MREEKEDIKYTKQRNIKPTQLETAASKTYCIQPHLSFVPSIAKDALREAEYICSCEFLQRNLPVDIRE